MFKPFNPEFAERLRWLREQRGMTPAELALEIRSVSGRRSVASWEAGTVPGAQWIPPLASVLEVSCHFLLTGEPLTGADHTAHTSMTADPIARATSEGS